jgi:hypothetical protein
MRWESHPADLRAVQLLGEIRDLLAARLPVPVEDLPAPTSESKLDKMRQSNAALRKENADLRAALDAAKEANDG